MEEIKTDFSEELVTNENQAQLNESKTNKSNFKNLMQQIFVENKFNSSNIAILNLINRFFWKSKITVVSMFLAPLLFMIIYFLISSQEGTRNISITFGLNLYIASAILPITLISLPQLLVEIKQSIILRRIAISSVSSFRYNMLMALYFFGMCTLAVLFIFIMLIIFLSSTSDGLIYFNNFDFGGYIYALITFFLTAIAFGILLSSIAKSSTWVQLAGIGILLLTLMIAGLFIPLEIIGGIQGVKVISFFVPLDYSLGMMNTISFAAEDLNNYRNFLDGFVENGAISQAIADDLINQLRTNLGGDIFNFNNSFNTLSLANVANNPSVVPTIENQGLSQIYLNWEKATNVVIPWILVVVSFYFSSRHFQWSSR